MSGEVHSLGDAREARIDRDSALAKLLMIDAIRAGEQIVSTLSIGEKEINDPQQLKALTEAVKQMIYERLSRKVFDVEDKRNLDDIDLFDTEIDDE